MEEHYDTERKRATRPAKAQDRHPSDATRSWWPLLEALLEEWLGFEGRSYSGCQQLARIASERLGRSRPHPRAVEAFVAQVAVDHMVARLRRWGRR